jgi:hypothetical protein
MNSSRITRRCGLEFLQSTCADSMRTHVDENPVRTTVGLVDSLSSKADDRARARF